MYASKLHRPGSRGIPSKASMANTLTKLAAKEHPATMPLLGEKGPSKIPPRAMHRAADYA
eukprot:8099749-Pyramimonas_sp.AAC.1